MQDIFKYYNNKLNLFYNPTVKTMYDNPIVFYYRGRALGSPKMETHTYKSNGIESNTVILKVLKYIINQTVGF